MAGWHVLVTGLLCTALLAGCRNNEPASLTGPSEPTPTAADGGPWLRVANLSADLEEVTVQLDGSVHRKRLVYTQVTSYDRVAPGSHRIRFVPPAKAGIDPRDVQLDTMLGVGTGDAMTVIIAGLVGTRTLRVAVVHDDPTPSGEGAKIRLIHAMSDFPAALDLWQDRRTPLVRRVEFLEDSPYRRVEAGNHPLQVRRSGTREPVVPVTPYGLARNASYTMFAFGTLLRGDLSARLVLDGSEGVLTLQR